MGRQVQRHTHPVVEGRWESNDAVGEWSATCNRANQESLLTQLSLVAGQTIDVIAERLGIEAKEVEAALSGKMDLTLTELRLLGIASDTIISYTVRAARPDYFRLMRSVTASYGHDEAVRRPVGNVSPAEYARRAVAATA
ncbi:MAG: hypothetical protein AAGC61_01905 [Microbacterium sp.]